MKFINESNGVRDILTEFKTELPSLREGKIDIEQYARKVHDLGRACVCEDAGVSKGFAIYYANDVTDKVAYLSMIAVKASYRRENIGTRLLRFVELDSFTHGMRSLRLEVNKGNEAAIRFYKKHAYKISEETSVSYYMTKELFGES